MKSNRIEEALAALARGQMIVVVDDEDRENEGDLILAAEHATSNKLAFMVRWSSGMICVGLPGERLDSLQLPQMVPNNSDAMGTAYTVTVDYRHGTSTGISAADRAATLRALVDPDARPGDFNRPGHVFPLRARPGGVLDRPATSNRNFEGRQGAGGRTHLVSPAMAAAAALAGRFVDVTEERS